MDVAAVNNALNITLIVLFSLLLAGVLVAGFVGYKRGVFKSTYRFVFLAILIVISIATLSPLTELIGSIDASKFHHQFKAIELTNNVTKEVAYVQITSIKETLYNFIKAYYKLFDVSGSSSQAYSAISGLTDSLLKLSIFFISMILIVTLGNLLSSILWHTIFKKFVPNIAKKTIRLRILSIAESVVIYSLTAFMLISPLSSLVNTSSSGFKKAYSSETSNNETLNNIDSLLTTYDNSIFNTVFGWDVTNDGLSLDSLFIDSLTKSSVENGTVSIIDAVSSISQIAGAVSNYVGEYVYDEENFASSINIIFDCLTSSNTFASLLPIAISMGLESDLLETEFDFRQLQLSESNFTYELDNIRYLILDLLDTGILNYILDPSEEDLFKKDVDYSSVIIGIIRNKENHDSIISALKRIDNSCVLSNLIPTLIKYLSIENQDYKMVFNATWDQLRDIKWGFELATIFDSLYTLDQNKPFIVDSIVEKFSSKKEENEDRDALAFMLNLFSENYEDIIELFVGEVNYSNNSIYLNENNLDSETGRTNVEGVSYCLMDLEISKYAFRAFYKSIIDTSEDSLSKEDIISLSEAFDSLTQKDWRRKTKVEISSLLYSLSSFKGHSSLLGKLLGGDIDFSTDKNVRDEMVDIFSIAFPRMDQSLILSSLLFPTIEEAFTNEEMKSNFSSLANYIDFNLIKAGFLESKTASPEGGEYRGHELGKIMSLLPKIISLGDDLSSTSLSNSEKVEIIGEKYLSLNEVLDGFYSSRILNPKNSLKNKNYYNLFNFIFDQAGGENKGFVFDPSSSFFPSISDRSDAYWLEQNKQFSLVIKSLGESSLLELASMNDVLFELTKEDASYRNKLRTFMKTVSDSDIFASTFGLFLDTTINNDFLIDKTNTSFQFVQDWQKEADCLYNLLSDLSRLEISLNTGIKFNEIKDVVGLNNLLHHLASSSIFAKGEEYTFPKWFYNKLDGSFTYNGEDLFKDPNQKEWTSFALSWGEYFDNSNSYRIAEYDFLQLDKYSSWSHGETFTYLTNEDLVSLFGNSKTYYENPSFYNSYFGNNKDELTSFVEVIYWINDVFGDLSDVLNKSEEEILSENISSSLSGLLHAINDTSTLRIVLFNVYKLLIKQIPTDSFIDFEFANLAYLIAGDNKLFTSSSISKEIRNEEIDYLVDIFTSIKNLRNEDVLSSTYLICLENLSSDVSTDIKTIFTSFNKSNVFHRYYQSVPLVKSWEPTPFQSALYSFLSSKMMKQLIYNPESPKDMDSSNVSIYSKFDSTLSLGKIKYLIATYFPSYENNYANQNNELNKFFDIIDATIGDSVHVGLKDKDGKTSFDFSNIDLSRNENAEAVGDILRALNASNMMYDAVGNAINLALSSGVLFESNFQGIDIDAANPYFVYQEGNYTTRYPDSEISLISSLIKEIISLKEDGFDASNISSLSNNDVFLSLENVLILAKDSHVLNFDSQYFASSNGLTVFEQLINKIMIDSSLSEYSYDSSRDASYLSNNEKTFALIKEFSLMDIDINARNSHIGYQTSFEEEIHSLLSSLRTIGETITTNENISDINLSSFTPKEVETLLYAFNNCDLASGAVYRFVKEGLASFKLDTYSSYNNVDYASYDLSPIVYGGDDGKSGEILNLVNLLNAIYDNDTKTYLLNDTQGYSLSSILENEKVSEGFMEFLLSSHIYNSNGDIYNEKFTISSSPYLLSTRGILLYNILDSLILGNNYQSLTQYIMAYKSSPSLNNGGETVSSLEKIGRLSAIFEIENISSDVEGMSFSSLMGIPASLGGENFDANDIECIKENSDVLKDCMEICFKNSRAYFASEIIGGVLTSIMEDEYTLIDKACLYEKIAFTPFEYDDVTSSSYNSINQMEADGLHGAINALSSIEELTPAISSLGVNKASYQTGVNIINNFNDMSKHGTNSSIAKIYYLSRMANIIKTIEPLGFSSYRDDVDNDTFPLFKDYGVSIVSFLTNEGIIEAQ